jgi:hypothetical protein
MLLQRLEFFNLLKNLGRNHDEFGTCLDSRSLAVLGSVEVFNHLRLLHHLLLILLLLHSGLLLPHSHLLLLGLHGQGLLLLLHLHLHLLLLHHFHLLSLLLKLSTSSAVVGVPCGNKVDGTTIFALVLHFPPVVHAYVDAEAGDLDGGFSETVVVLNDVLVHNAHREIITNVFDVVSELFIKLGVLATVGSDIGRKFSIGARSQP